MKEDKFIKENSNTWKNLELTLNNLKKGSINKFDKDDLDNFINLYNKACGHLSYSRTYYGETNTTNYLNRLVAAAHSYIYTTKSSNLRRLRDFLFITFPQMIVENFKYILLSGGLFLGASLLCFIFILVSTENAVAFLPPQTVEALMKSTPSANSSAQVDSPLFSSFILTNNIRVGILAFCLGVTFGIGTLWVLITNGYVLGGYAAIFFHKGANLLFWSLILPHGILELFAIFVCGGAGLMLGYSMINPGNLHRKDAFILNGKKALLLMLGTIPIFIVAGIIEGFVTPSGYLNEIAKLAFALVTLGLLILYIVFPYLRSKRKLQESNI